MSRSGPGKVIWRGGSRYLYWHFPVLHQACCELKEVTPLCLSSMHPPLMYYQVTLGALSGLSVCSVILLLFFSGEVQTHLQI